jgi:hypothetical protein
VGVREDAFQAERLGGAVRLGEGRAEEVRRRQPHDVEDVEDLAELELAGPGEQAAQVAAVGADPQPAFDFPVRQIGVADRVPQHGEDAYNLLVGLLAHHSATSIHQMMG